MRPTTASRPAAAFTLLEVLVAIFILSVGLLGLAGLQSASMRNNNSAAMRSQATVLANDIADRIRANPDGDYITPLPNGTQQTNCLSTTGCSEDAMAQNDIYEWQYAVGDNLPTGTGSLAVSGGIYTITITWDDRFSGTADHVFTTSFIP